MLKMEYNKITSTLVSEGDTDCSENFINAVANHLYVIGDAHTNPIKINGKEIEIQCMLILSYNKDSSFSLNCEVYATEKHTDEFEWDRSDSEIIILSKHISIEESMHIVNNEEVALYKMKEAASTFYHDLLRTARHKDFEKTHCL